MLDLITYYFNLEELRTLCLDLRIPFEELGGQGLRGVARELLFYMRRRDRLPELLAALRAERPTVAWPTADELEATLAPDAAETPPATPPQVGRDYYVTGDMHDSVNAIGPGASVSIGQIPKRKKRKDKPA